MAHFKVRKSGSDLGKNKFFNSYGNGKYNPYFPEVAPKVVGGDMTDSTITYKDSKGNCTWYAFGRYQEVHGVRPEYPMMRGNAGTWGTKGEKTTSGPEVGGIVVFGDGGYGHVAFIEKIENGVAYLSESSYSTRGNDFTFKYGRTIDDVKRAWGMTVLRYIAPASPSTSYDEISNEVAEDGKITVTVSEGLRVRKSPSLSAEQIGLLSKGTEKVYTHYVDADGIRWVKLKEGGYAARRDLSGGKTYADAEFLKAAPKPKPTLVGKNVKLSGPTKLFHSATGSTTYPYSSTNRTTDLATRHVPVLEDKGDRVLVRIAGFDPEKIWINKNELR